MEPLYKDSINYYESKSLSISTEIKESSINIENDLESISLPVITKEDQLSRWERMICDGQSPLKEIQTEYHFVPIFPQSFLNFITQFLHINPKKTVKLLHYILNGPFENIDYLNWKEIFQILIIHLPHTIPIICHALSIEKTTSIKKAFLELGYFSRLYEFQNQPSFHHDLSFILKVLAPYKIISYKPKKQYLKNNFNIFLGTDPDYLNVFYKFGQESKEIGIGIDINYENEKKICLDVDFNDESKQKSSFSTFCETLLRSDDYEVIENVFEAFLLMDPKDPDYDFIPYLIISNLDRFAAPTETVIEEEEVNEPLIEEFDNDEDDDEGIILIGNEPNLSKTEIEEPDFTDTKQIQFTPIQEDDDEEYRSQLDEINIYILTILGYRLNSHIIPYIPKLLDYIQQFLKTTVKPLINAFCIFIKNVIKQDNFDLLIDLGIAQKISFLISFDWDYKTKINMISIMIDVVNSCGPTVFKELVSSDLLMSFIDYTDIDDITTLTYILSILSKMIRFWDCLQPPVEYFNIIASGKGKFEDLSMSTNEKVRDMAQYVLGFIEAVGSKNDDFC